MKFTISLCAFLITNAVILAQPIDNPYKSRYGGVGHWTDSLKWDVVTSVTSFGAVPNDQNDDRAAIQQGIDQINANGGGVLFFPEGTYLVNDHLTIKSGVVLRGVTPIGITSAKQTGYSPPSKLVFPKYVFDTLANNGRGYPRNSAFKGIEGAKSCSNAGLVNLDINRAYIGFHPEFDPTPVPPATTPQPIQKNRNLIIFGLRSNNAVILDRRIPDTTIIASSGLPRQKRWQRFPWRFSANIDAFVHQNCVIANNRLNDGPHDSFEMPNYRIQQRGTNKWIDLGLRTVGTGWKAEFNVNDHYGIALNRAKIYKDSLGGYQIYGVVTYATPEKEPSLFSIGNEVRDNWVYKTSRVGITAAGIGLIIKGNETHDLIGKDTPALENFTGPTGNVTPQGATTFENRGIDFSGWQVNVDSNYIFATRNYTTGYLSTDGEGILLQECCGGTQVNDLKITNNNCFNYVGIYKMRDINNVLIKNNKMNGSTIYINANTNWGNFYLNSCVVDGNTQVGGLQAVGNRGGTAGRIINNVATGKADVSCHVEFVGGNQGFTVQYKAVDPDLPSGGGGNVHGPCSASTIIPLISNLTASVDSLVSNIGGPYLVRFKITQGDVPNCKVDIYLGSVIVASDQVPGADSTVTYSWTPPPTGNGIFAFTAKVKHGTFENFSPVVKFIIATPVSRNPLYKSLPDFSVYPNPAKNELTIRLQNQLTGSAEFILMDGIGKQLKQWKATQDASQLIDLQAFSPGLYTLQVKDANGSKLKKVVIER